MMGDFYGAHELCHQEEKTLQNLKAAVLEVQKKSGRSAEIYRLSCKIDNLLEGKAWCRGAILPKKLTKTINNATDFLNFKLESENIRFTEDESRRITSLARDMAAILKSGDCSQKLIVRLVAVLLKTKVWVLKLDGLLQNLPNESVSFRVCF